MQAGSVAELLAYAKAHPGELNVAVPNSTGRLASAQLLKLTGVDMTAVPYKGEAAALPDLLTGRVHLMLVSTTSVLDRVKEGKLKALAILGDKRSVLAPGVPTLAEAGVRGVSIVPWVGVFAPSGLPGSLAARLAADVAAVLADPEIAAQLAQQGLATDFAGPEKSRAFVDDQIDAWNKLVEENAIERD